jgi:hypothetical protein
MEEWRDIPGFEGFYQASSTGLIRRKTRFYNSTFKGKPVSRKIKEKIFVPSYSAKQYPRLSIVHQGKAKQFFVHYLVALAFLGERPVGYQVNHIDGDKSNNRPGNLEYVTNQENRDHAVAHGLHPMRSNGFAKISIEDAKKIRDLYRMGFLQREIARVYQVCQQTISIVLRDENTFP